MATTQVAQGVELTHPSTVRIEIISGTPSGPAGIRRMRAVPGETTALPGGLADSGLSVAADVIMTPPRGTLAPMRALEATTPSVLVDVAPGEGAVVLVQANGVYSWLQADEAPPGPMLRGALRQVRFTIAALPAQPPGTAPAPLRRGILTEWLTDVVVDQIRVTIFKFLGRWTAATLAART